MIYVGRITSTHGIRGELKIKSNAQFKEKVFKVGSYLIIDGVQYQIRSYRVHKQFDMVTLNDYKDINEVLGFVRKKVFKSITALNLEEHEVLDKDLFNYQIKYEDQFGEVKEVFYASPTNKMLRVVFDDKEVLIPYQKEFIQEIDYDNQIITVQLTEGML